MDGMRCGKESENRGVRIYCRKRGKQKLPGKASFKLRPEGWQGDNQAGRGAVQTAETAGANALSQGGFQER